MYNIDHFKRLVGAELEALVKEIDELKKRVSELECDKFHKSYADSKEFVGKWLEQKSSLEKTKESSTITCNTSEIF